MHDDDVIGWETDPDRRFDQVDTRAFTVTPEGITVKDFIRDQYGYLVEVDIPVTDEEAFWRRRGMRPVTRGEKIAQLRKEIAKLEGADDARTNES